MALDHSIRSLHVDYSRLSEKGKRETREICDQQSNAQRLQQRAGAATLEIKRYCANPPIAFQHPSEKIKDPVMGRMAEKL